MIWKAVVSLTQEPDEDTQRSEALRGADAMFYADEDANPLSNQDSALKGVQQDAIRIVDGEEDDDMERQAAQGSDAVAY